MNIYLIIILTFIIGGYIIDLIVERLNAGRLDPKLPAKFIGYYDEEKYATSQRYTKTNTNFGLIHGAVDTVIIIPFILLGGFNYVDQIVRSFQWGEIRTGVLFALILMVASQILRIPFSFYHTFVIEEKYGFNKTTPKTAIIDEIKSLIISNLINSGILALVIWFFSSFGDSAWLYAWGAVSIVVIFLMFLFPMVIMPLFNKFTLLEDGELKDTVKKYANKYNFKMKGIYTMDGSKRSTKANAYFTGFGKSRRIVFYDTMIEQYTVKELLVVLAHEVGHYKLKHIFKMVTISITTMGLMFYLLSFFLGNQGLFDAFKMEHLSIYGSIVFMMFLYAPFSSVLGIAMNGMSRKHEYQADRFASRTTNDSESMIVALKKLSVQNLSNLTPHPLKVFLSYDHPPVLERIAALEKTD